MSILALAWLLKKPSVGSVIAGARNPEQTKGIVAATDFEMSDALSAELSEITEPLKTALGPNADPWDGTENSRVR